MPYRHTLIVPGQTYHVFNRSIARQPIFLNSRYFQRGLETINFYRYLSPPLRFSHFNRLPKVQKENFENKLKTSKKLIEILAFAIMPNHFHFILQENEENGISTFMRNFQNSYAKFYNTKHERNGALFQSMFKIVRIETDEQLLHVVRYVHINPLTSYMLKDINDLELYPWTSYKAYLHDSNSNLVNTSFVLSYYDSLMKFIQFTCDQVDYQRTLSRIKHLTL